MSANLLFRLYGWLDLPHDDRLAERRHAVLSECHYAEPDSGDDKDDEDEEARSLAPTRTEDRYSTALDRAIARRIGYAFTACMQVSLVNPQCDTWFREKRNFFRSTPRLRSAATRASGGKISTRLVAGNYQMLTVDGHCKSEKGGEAARSFAPTCSNVCHSNMNHRSWLFGKIALFAGKF